jgi:hypothetical protein
MTNGQLHQHYTRISTPTTTLSLANVTGVDFAGRELLQRDLDAEESPSSGRIT